MPFMCLLLMFRDIFSLSVLSLLKVQCVKSSCSCEYSAMRINLFKNHFHLCLTNVIHSSSVQHQLLSLPTSAVMSQVCQLTALQPMKQMLTAQLPACEQLRLKHWNPKFRVLRGKKVRTSAK